MAHSINLSTTRKSVNPLLRRFFIASLSVLCVVFIISLSLLGYRLYLKLSYDKLVEREKQLNNQLLTLHDKKVKIEETKSRLSDLRRIISKRSPVTIRIAKVSTTVGEESEIYSISGTSSEVNIKLENPNLGSMDELVEQKLISLASDKKQDIKRVEVKSLGLSSGSDAYDLSFGLFYK